AHDDVAADAGDSADLLVVDRPDAEGDRDRGITGSGVTAGAGGIGLERATGREHDQRQQQAISEHTGEYRLSRWPPRAAANCSRRSNSNREADQTRITIHRIGYRDPPAAQRSDDDVPRRWTGGR